MTPPNPAAREMETVDAARPRRCDECPTIAPYHPLTCLGIDLTEKLPFLCPDCQAAADARETEEARLRLRRQIEQTWESTIDPEYRATDLQDPRFNSAAWARVRNLSFQNRGIGLVGPPARCKTRFLALFARKAIELGITVAWTNTFRIAEAAEQRTSYKSSGDEARASLRGWKSARLLFLDDLGKSRWTPLLEAALFDLLEARHAASKITHWSLNPQPEDAGQPITTELLTRALDPDGIAARRATFAPILSRLMNDTLILPIR